MGNTNVKIGNRSYQLLDTLGSGSFGTAFLIKDNRGVKHTLKVFNPDLVVSTEAEINSLTTIRDIMGGCQLHLQCFEEAFEINSSESGYKSIWKELKLDNDTYGLPLVCTLSRYVEGYDLQTIIWAGRYDPEIIAFDFLNQILPAVALLHNHGIAHRDIKPGNLIYNEKLQTFTLIDFGLACINKCVDVAGTPGYVYPDLQYDQSLWMYKVSDTFACGVVLYEILSQQMPFRILDNNMIDKTSYQPLTNGDPRLLEMVNTLLFNPQLGAARISDKWREMMDNSLTEWSVL